MAKRDRKQNRQRVRHRIKKKIRGTAERPRLAVHFSNRNVYAQLIDDQAGRTLAAASTMEKDTGVHRSNVEAATAVGKLIGERAKTAKVEQVIYDRGGFVYHGKVKALADGAREAGLQF